jgi:hypothetical protein
MKNKILTILASICLLASFTACKSTLAPNGAYVVNGQPDMAFFAADGAYQVAYNTVDAVFTFEQKNRAYLWSISPQIKKTLDSIRPQAVKANQEYLIARTTYMSNPTPAGLTGVQQVLAKMQQLVATAISVIPKQ